MARLPKIPYEITNQIYGTLCEFGSARWRALLSYSETLAESDFTPEGEVLKDNAEGAGLKALQTLMAEERIVKTKYAGEDIVVPAGDASPSYDALNAFEAFSCLIREMTDNDQHPEFCYAGKTETYPFHYIIAASKQERLYRVLIYGQDAHARLGFLNSTYNKKRDGKLTTILVVPDSFSWEDFTDVVIKGKTRIAFLAKKKGAVTCLLSDVIEEE